MGKFLKFLIITGFLIFLFFFGVLWYITIPITVILLVFCRKKTISFIKKMVNVINKGKFTCPYCYAEHDINSCGLKCSHDVTGTGKECKIYVYKDRGKWIDNEYKKKCLKCKETSVHLFCMEEKKEIPIEFLEMKSLPIALLGAKASGKSNYIGVLIDEIRKKMAQPFNCSLSMSSSAETKKTYQENYYRPLFEQGYTVKATDAGEMPPPLIFPLKFMNDNGKFINMTALTFYDTAGENLDDHAIMHIFNRYISNAKGIIMLLDPLQVPQIRQKLTANGFKNLPAQNTDTSLVLDTVVNVIRNVKKVKGKIDIPLALVLTKIDVLEEYSILPSGSCLKEESGHINSKGFKLEDCENTDLEIKALLENWFTQNIFPLTNQFKKCSFFGVTALGANPEGGTKIQTPIKPRRVLDPLLWLLAENGYIKTISYK